MYLQFQEFEQEKEEENVDNEKELSDSPQTKIRMCMLKDELRIAQPSENIELSGLQSKSEQILVKLNRMLKFNKNKSNLKKIDENVFE